MDFDRETSIRSVMNLDGLPVCWSDDQNILLLLALRQPMIFQTLYMLLLANAPSIRNFP